MNSDNHKDPSNTPINLCEQIMRFMPQFITHIDPIVHQGRYGDTKISENQIKVVMMLKHVGEASPGEISRRLNIQKGSLTTILKSLRRLDLVRRRDKHDDERSYQVALSPEGCRFAENHEVESRRRLEHLFESMDARERLSAQSGLDRINRYLEKKGIENEKC